MEKYKTFFYIEDESETLKPFKKNQRMWYFQDQSYQLLPFE